MMTQTEMITMTATAYTSFQRTIAREALEEHDASCCTPVARCEIGTGLERISTATRMTADVYPERTERELPRGNGNSTGYGRTEKLASDAQMRFLNSLLATLESAPEGSNHAIARDCVKADMAQRAEQNRPLDMRTASRAIDTLKKLADAMPRTVAAPVRPQAQSDVQVPLSEGLYKVGTEVFKVRASRSSGHLYAMVLTDNGDRSGSFEYAPGAMRKILPEHRMSLEDASRFGHTFHFCVCCGRQLTRKESIERGIGPICASKL
jgi:hypothetical protein